MAQEVEYLIKLRDRFGGTARRFDRTFKNMQMRIRRVSIDLKKLSANFTSFGKSVLLRAGILGGLAVKAFTDYESALFNVAKTANIEVGPALDKFGEKIQRNSERLGVSAKNLANFAAISAQLGVKGEGNLLKFADVVAKLQKTTNILGEEGAAQLARLMNVVGASKDQVDKFASAIVGLGNTSAATESEILRFATDLASRSAVFGLSGTQALGLAAAFKSIGLQSELASSAIGRNLANINKAIATGGTEMKVLQFVTGQTRDQLQKAFKKDALSVLLDFGRGLNKLQKEGKNLSVIMQAFGAEGIRDATVLGTLAKKSDLVSDRLRFSAKSFEENIALTKEYETRMKSLGSQIGVTATKGLNRLNSATGENKKLMLDVLSLFNRFFGFIERNPELVKFAVTLGGIAAGLGLISLAAGFLISPLGAVAAILTGIGFVFSKIIKQSRANIANKVERPAQTSFSEIASNSAAPVKQHIPNSVVSQSVDSVLKGLLSVKLDKGLMLGSFSTNQPDLALNVATP